MSRLFLRRTALSDLERMMGGIGGHMFNSPFTPFMQPLRPTDPFTMARALLQEVPRTREGLMAGDQAADQAYSYSYSTSSTYSPETGHISHSSKEYQDSDGHTKRIVERVLGEKAVTETWENDAEGQGEPVKTLSLRQIQEDKLEDFEHEWEKKSENLYGAMSAMDWGEHDEHGHLLASSHEEELEKEPEEEKAVPKPKTRKAPTRKKTRAASPGLS